jgi:hypothetical protein
MTEYPICRHIKTNGLQCHSPALIDGNFCYFHNRIHARQLNYRPNDHNRMYFEAGRDLELCTIEDRESVQFSLSIVINALATGRIEIKRATALLYGLQLASSNAARLNLSPDTPNVVRNVESLSNGLDLAEPGAIIEVYERLEDREDRKDNVLPDGPAARGEVTS